MHLKLFFFTLHIFNFFYPEINKPNIHNNITDISSFQNWLNGLFSSAAFYLKRKVAEGSQNGKNMLFIFWALLLKMCIFEVVTFFSCLVFIQSTQFFSGITYLYNSCFCWSIFPLNYQNAYDHQNFQGGDMLQGALTHICAWYQAEWSCGVMWQIKHKSPPAEDVSISN